MGCPSEKFVTGNLKKQQHHVTCDVIFSISEAISNKQLKVCKAGLLGLKYKISSFFHVGVS